MAYCGMLFGGERKPAPPAWLTKFKTANRAAVQKKKVKRT